MNLFVLTKTRIASIVGVVSAIVLILQVFSVFSISDAQAVLIAAETSSLLVLVAAVMVHFRPGLPQETVGIAGSVTALSTSTVALIVGFHAVNWTDTQIAAVLGVVAVVLSLWNNWIARDDVTAEITPPKEV